MRAYDEGMSFVLEPLGQVVCSRKEPTDDNWDSESCVIELSEAIVSPDATLGLLSFSHIERPRLSARGWSFAPHPDSFIVTEDLEHFSRNGEAHGGEGLRLG